MFLMGIDIYMLIFFWLSTWMLVTGCWILDAGFWI